MDAPQSPVKTIIPVATGLILLGIGLHTGMHGATAIGLILAVLFGVRWLRSRPVPGHDTPHMAGSRDLLFIASGIAGLLLGSYYAGPGDVLVHSYAGNICVSFAVYFLAKRVTPSLHRPEILAAVLALGVVELFEVTDGFGIMKNTYDPLDLAANAVGVGAALLLDRVLKGRVHDRVG
jgi:hypothetical protein